MQHLLKMSYFVPKSMHDLHAPAAVHPVFFADHCQFVREGTKRLPVIGVRGYIIWAYQGTTVMFLFDPTLKIAANLESFNVALKHATTIEAEAKAAIVAHKLAAKDGSAIPNVANMSSEVQKALLKQLLDLGVEVQTPTAPPTEQAAAEDAGVAEEAADKKKKKK
jgi:hypothetical protein